MKFFEMNSKLDSVQSHWNDILYSQNKRYDLDKICSEYSKTFMNQYIDTTEFNFNPANTPFENCLLLKLVGNNSSWVDYYKNKTIKISKKAGSFIEYSNQKYKDNQPKQLFDSSRVLEGYAILACIIEFDSPSIPNKKVILEAIVRFKKRLKLSKTKIPFDEKEKCILASVLALLADEVELAVEFLTYCKNLKEVKHHYSVMSQIIDELKSGKKISENFKVETAFFDTFNAYRLPVVRQKRLALGEYAIIDNLVANYLFAWLYLKLFEEKTETTWEEMRSIMMG